MGKNSFLVALVFLTEFVKMDSDSENDFDDMLLMEEKFNNTPDKTGALAEKIKDLEGMVNALVDQRTDMKQYTNETSKNVNIILCLQMFQWIVILGLLYVIFVK